MENQGKFTADRPRNIAGGEIFNGGMSIVFTPFGDRFRRMRRSVIRDIYFPSFILLINVMQSTSFASTA